MTLDEAIKHCRKVAWQNENASVMYKQKKEASRFLEKDLAEKAELDCLQCAEEHRQLAEWLRELKTRRTQFEKICIELSELFGCPCNFSPMDEIMIEAEGCVEDCGDVTDSECWRRYFKTKGV